MSEKLTGISETLLIPLWLKAIESKMPRPIIIDNKAGEIVSQIDYDFTKFKSARFSQLGVSVRTMLLDNALTDFIKNNKDIVVVNLGAGLDTRRERLGLDHIRWYDLDVPEAIEIRRRFFEETENCRFIAKSMFDYDWMDQIEDSGKSVIIIAEGLFMYFEEYQLKNLMGKLAERYPGAQMLLEVLGPMLVGKSKHHDSLGKMDAAPEFKWGIKHCKDITRWHPDIHYLDEWCYFDYHKERAGLIGYILRLPFIRPHVASRIVHLKFDQQHKQRGLI